jgi:type IV pilus assembly protein PilV
MRRRAFLDPARGPVRRPCGRRSAGFTLVEVIVAIVLLGVGLMGLAALSTTVTRANVQSSSLTTATALAQERAERLRTEDYDALASGNDSRVVDNVTYTRSWVVTADDPEPGLKTVAIAVSWTTRGTTHTTRLTTIRGRR